MEVTCSRCNALNPEGSAFCANCGTPFRTAETYDRTWPKGRAVAGARPTGPVIAAPRHVKRRQAANGRKSAPNGAAPRVAQATAAAPVAPWQGPTSNGAAHQAAPRRRPAAPPKRTRRWYQRWKITVPLAILALLLTGMAAGAWYINNQFDTLNDLSTPPPEISGADLGADEIAAGGEGGGEAGGGNLTVDTNAASEHVAGLGGNDPDLLDSPDGSMAILVMGVDAREDEPIDIKVRADSLSVVFLDGEDNSCRMLSIPRDTRVELPGYGYTKINSALSIGGIPYQQIVVEQLLGIDIDHYGLIDFTGIKTLVDAVGGVTVENDAPFTTRSDITYASGRITLNGFAALEYARFRDDPEGDFGRQRRQQQVVRALMGEAASLNAVTAIPEMLDAVEGHVRTDLGPTDLIDIAQEFRSGCTAETLETAGIDGTIQDDWDDIMQQDLSFVLVEDAEVEQKVAWLHGED